MKFLVLFSVLALCALNVNGLFHKHFSKGGASASGSASVVEAPVAPAAPSSSGGGLGGLGNLLAIPLSIKKQLLLSHQKKINARFDGILGHLNKLSSRFSSSSSAGANANAGGSIDIGLSGGVDSNVAVNGNGGGSATFDEYSSGSASVATSGSDASFGGLSVGGSISHDNGYQQQQSYQPAVHSYHPEPAAQVQYQENPVTVELYQVQQPQVQHRYEPAPIAPAQTYGPPGYQPSAPIIEPQVIQEVQQPPTIQRDYLPPHTHRAGCTH